ncbi:phage tail protein [Phaeobacter sp. J2-8]|uniref:tail fiber protein n=1 Tax=Phaeobacter sp. J2-8 TaxID=2931394 RepID=UPI001FD5D809|nr:phage tail protein [Phaeobacter sp. J2-8]MCJ7874801.1 phage tail protein [Phaeobacter sp. J2-8]
MAQENYVGQIIPVAFTFCPRTTVPAEGQLLSPNQHQALFSLYGTIFGGMVVPPSPCQTCVRALRWGMAKVRVFRTGGLAPRVGPKPAF